MFFLRLCPQTKCPPKCSYSMQLSLIAITMPQIALFQCTFHPLEPQVKKKNHDNNDNKILKNVNSDHFFFLIMMIMIMFMIVLRFKKVMWKLNISFFFKEGMLKIIKKKQVVWRQTFFFFSRGNVDNEI